MSVSQRIASWFAPVTAGIGAAVVFTGGYVYAAGASGTAPDKEPWLVSTLLGYAVIAAYGLLWVALARWAWTRGQAAGRIAKLFVTIVLATLSALGAVGIAVIAIFFVASIGSHPGSALPDSQTDARLTVLLVLVVIVGAATLLAVLWARQIEHAKPWIAGFGVVVVDVLVLVALPGLAQKQPQASTHGLTLARATEGMQLRHDVLLLVDPGDRAGRRLIRLAATQPGLLTQERDGIPRWNVATGIAVPTRVGGSPSVEVRPTTNRRDLLVGLRSIERQRSPVSPRAMVAAATALAGSPRVWARRGSVRTIAWITDVLPSLRGIAPPATPGAVASLKQRKRITPLVVVASVGSPARQRKWAAWARRSGGSLVMPDTFIDDRQPVDMAEDAATGRPDAAAQELATKYRPYLKFDRSEPYRPLDIDAYFAERDDAGEPAHQQCRSKQLVDPCTPVTLASDLKPSSDYLESVNSLTKDPQIKPDVGRTDPTRERIYYHRSPEQDGRIQLDYWWFLRFNASPVARELMCLRGLAISETTCFDHEGDWEGVTVTLQRSADSPDGWTPEAVSYAGHAWRYRYQWPWLEHANAVDAQTHPVVYSAYGSHASYPARCTHQGAPRKFTCHQIGSLTPDGLRNPARDLASDWASNGLCDNCVLPLPTDPLGQPALWNAFPGKWGAPACTVGMKLCVRGPGPETPSAQGRYRDPAGGLPGLERDLYQRAGVRP